MDRSIALVVVLHKQSLGSYDPDGELPDPLARP